MFETAAIVCRALELDRTAIAAGEVWRLFTCHAMHWSIDHLAWDLLAFLCLLPLCLRESVRRTWWTLAAASLAISGAVLVFLPEMERYRGLSGLDSALFVFLAASRLTRGRSGTVAGVALGLFAAKLAFEMATGSTLFTSVEGFVPVPLAHLVGALCGGACASLWRAGPTSIVGSDCRASRGVRRERRSWRQSADPRDPLENRAG